MIKRGKEHERRKETPEVGGNFLFIVSDNVYGVWKLADRFPSDGISIDDFQISFLMADRKEYEI